MAEEKDLSGYNDFVNYDAPPRKDVCRGHLVKELSNGKEESKD